MSEKEWKKVAKKLVSVTAGKNSFLGEFTGEWDGGKIILREAISHGTKQVMAEVPSPTHPDGVELVPAQIPAPGLLPWLVNEPVCELEVVPDHLYRLDKQSDATQEAAASMYLEFIEYLREARQKTDSLVQPAAPGDMAAIERASAQSGGILPSFGPPGRK